MVRKVIHSRPKVIDQLRQSVGLFRQRDGMDSVHPPTVSCDGGGGRENGWLPAMKFPTSERLPPTRLSAHPFAMPPQPRNRARELKANGANIVATDLSEFTVDEMNRLVGARRKLKPG